MKTINIKGINIRYLQEGTGEDIVILHGWGQRIETMLPIHDFLKENFRVTTLDLPGFGESEEPKSPWNVFDYTKFLETFIKKLELKKPILIAHSFGGRIAIVYSSRNEIEKLILLSSAGIKSKKAMNLFTKIKKKIYKTLIKIPIIKKYEDFLKSKIGSHDYRNSSPIMRKVLVHAVEEDLTEFLPKIKAATLLVWGTNDEETPISDARTMEKLIPNSGLVEYPNSGHYAFLENFLNFKKVLANFLNIK
ncbi:MAG TPA: alpha/beta hydrolase [Tenericutes bacterium]|nr:alpha/beta hydrolase [Mycoplasmatota bacterium]